MRLFFELPLDIDRKQCFRKRRCGERPHKQAPHPCYSVCIRGRIQNSLSKNIPSLYTLTTLLRRRKIKKPISQLLDNAKHTESVKYCLFLCQSVIPMCGRLPVRRLPKRRCTNRGSVYRQAASFGTTFRYRQQAVLRGSGVYGRLPKRRCTNGGSVYRQAASFELPLDVERKQCFGEAAMWQAPVQVAMASDHT